MIIPGQALVVAPVLQFAAGDLYGPKLGKRHYFGSDIQRTLPSSQACSA
jgi:hypothetical protein